MARGSGEVRIRHLLTQRSIEGLECGHRRLQAEANVKVREKASVLRASGADVCLVFLMKVFTQDS